MTQQFFLGQLRLIAIALIAYATGRGWLSTTDSSLLGAILPPVGLIIGPWIWSIYSNLNMKLMPKNSIAIPAEHVANAATAVSSGTAIVQDESGKTVQVKAVA